MPDRNLTPPGVDDGFRVLELKMEHVEIIGETGMLRGKEKIVEEEFNRLLGATDIDLMVDELAHDHNIRLMTLPRMTVRVWRPGPKAYAEALAKAMHKTIKENVEQCRRIRKAKERRAGEPAGLPASGKNRRLMEPAPL